MSRDMQPLFWRINEQDHQGMEAVSLLMPTNDTENSALEMPTNVHLRTDGQSSYPMDLRWSSEDQELFMSLLERIVGQELEGNIELDLTDEKVWNLIQLVALSRFKTAIPVDEMLAEDFICERAELSIGDMVAVNTQYGYPLAVVVGLDSIDVSCVLLEDIIHQQQVKVPKYSLLMVNRLSALPAVFANTAISEDAVLH